MWIMIAGPYRSGSLDPAIWAKHLQQLNVHAHAVFKKGHVPIIGVNLALPIIQSAGEEHYDEIMILTPGWRNWQTHTDLKSCDAKASCGFDPRPRHFRCNTLQRDEFGGRNNKRGYCSKTVADEAVAITLNLVFRFRCGTNRALT